MKVESEESNDSSIRVCVAPHHEAKKEIISLSNGTDTESSSEVPSHSARMGTTGGRLSSKRKQRGTSFSYVVRNFQSYLYNNRVFMWSRVLILQRSMYDGAKLVLLIWEGSKLLVLNTVKPVGPIFS
jgi:hypothetical protein